MLLNQRTVLLVTQGFSCLVSLTTLNWRMDLGVYELNIRKASIVLGRVFWLLEFCTACSYTQTEMMVLSVCFLSFSLYFAFLLVFRKVNFIRKIEKRNVSLIFSIVVTAVILIIVWVLYIIVCIKTRPLSIHRHNWQQRNISSIYVLKSGLWM